MVIIGVPGEVYGRVLSVMPVTERKGSKEQGVFLRGRGRD